MSLRVNLAWVRIEAKEYLAAYRECRAALDLDPENAAAYNYLGLVFMHIQRYQEALEAFGTALSKDPGYRAARMNLAFLHGVMGNSEEAVREYKGLIDKDPQNAEAHFNLGINYKKQGRFVLAAYHLQRAAELYGTDTPLGRRALGHIEEKK